MFQILWWTPWNFHGILWARRRGPLAAATRSIIRRVVHTTADSCMQEFGQGVHQIVPHNSLYRPNDVHREFPRDLKDMQFQRWLSVKEFWKSVVIWLNLNPWNNYFLRSIIFLLIFIVVQQIMRNNFHFGVMCKFEMVEKLKLQHRGNLTGISAVWNSTEIRLAMFWLQKEIVPKLQKSWNLVSSENTI